MRKLALLLIVAAPFASACITTRAQTPTERPALEVPPVPPRVLEPVASTEPTNPEPVGDLPPAPVPPRTRPPVRDTAANNGQTSREPARQAEPKTETPPPTEAAPAAPPSAAPPVSPLRTPSTADSAQAERQVRDVITSAGTMLSRVDYTKLTSDRKKAYNDAKLFMQQAEDAMKESNFVYARELAGKAERLAKELQTR